MLSAILTANLLVATPAIAINVSGDVQVGATATETHALNRFDRVEQGATVVTRANASVELRFASGSLIRLGPNTSIKLTELAHSTPVSKRRESMKLIVGRLWARVEHLFGRDSHFQVESNNAVAGVRGTIFVAENFGPDSTKYTLLEGAMEVKVGDDLQLLNQPGATATVTPDGTTVGQLTPQETNQAKKNNQTPGADLSDANPPDDDGENGENNREGDRGDIIGPNGTVDTPLSASENSLGETIAPADVTVNINLPAP